MTSRTLAAILLLLALIAAACTSGPAASAGPSARPHPRRPWRRLRRLRRLRPSRRRTRRIGARHDRNLVGHDLGRPATELPGISRRAADARPAPGRPPRSSSCPPGPMSRPTGGRKRSKGRATRSRASMGRSRMAASSSTPPATRAVASRRASRRWEMSRSPRSSSGHNAPSVSRSAGRPPCDLGRVTSSVPRCSTSS